MKTRSKVIQRLIYSHPIIKNTMGRIVKGKKSVDINLEPGARKGKSQFFKIMKKSILGVLGK